MTTIEEARGSRRSMAFWLGCLAMFTAGLSFALRAAVAKDLQVQFLEPIDITRSATMIGVALGAAFLGFSIMLIVSSTLLDRIGMKRMLLIAWAAFVVGTAGILFCGTFGGVTTYHVLVASMFITGLGWGAVEGTTNPLVASLYPDDTTHWMNMLHAWWPAGLIVGGLTGVFGAQIGLDWRVIIALVPIFATVLGLLVLRCEFPQTTSVALGVTTRQQFAEVVRRPTFLI